MPLVNTTTRNPKAGFNWSTAPMGCVTETGNVHCVDDHTPLALACSQATVDRESALGLVQDVVAGQARGALQQPVQHVRDQPRELLPARLLVALCRQPPHLHPLAQRQNK